MTGHVVAIEATLAGSQDGQQCAENRTAANPAPVMAALADALEDVKHLLKRIQVNFDARYVRITWIH